MPGTHTYLLFLILALLLSMKTDKLIRFDQKWSDTLLARALIREARQLNSDDNHQDALLKAEQASAIYSRWYGEQDPLTAKARMYIAREYRNLNREGEALDLFRQSLPAFETVGDTFRIASCHLNIGLCLRNLNRFSEAHKHLQAGIELLRPDSTKQSIVIADLYVGIGSVFNAEKNYEAAIPVLENAKTVYVLKHLQKSLGMTSYHLGNAWFGIHDYVRAQENYLTALANLKNEIKPSHSYFADLYVKIGVCCQQTGDSALGLHHMLEARDAYIKAGTEDLNYIQFLQNLGEFYLNDHKYPDAVEQLELCLGYKEKHFGEQDFHLLSCLQILGEACMQDGQFNRAATCYKRALYLTSHALAENEQTRYRIYSKLAELHLKQGDIAGCLQHCDTAFIIAGYNPHQPGNMPSGDYFRDLCQLYAGALYKQFEQTSDLGFLLRSEQYFALAAEILYREVEAITVNTSREIFYDRDHLLFEQWLDAQMRLFAVTGNIKHAEAAFQIASRSKSFLLLKAMRQTGALRYAGVPDSILQAERSLYQRIDINEKQVAAFRQRRDAPNNDTLLQLNQELTLLRKEYDVLLRHIESSYPEYFKLQHWQPDIPSTKLRRKALATDQALLLYSLTDTRPYAFLLTRDTFCALALAPAPGLDAELMQFRKCLTEYHTNPDPDDDLYDRNLDTCTILSQTLYRQLILPLAGLLPRRVLLIPDRKLWYLSFEALLSGPPGDAGNFRTYPFLGHEKSFSYVLSPEFLLKKPPSPQQKNLGTWLGLAPFSGAAGEVRMNSNTVTAAPLDQLPYSGVEVEAIANLLHGDSWLGLEASPGRFEQQAAQYRILHLATHSRSDDRLGNYAYLALSSTGDLTPAKDIYRFSLDADMVVLSACETGAGQLLRGEGIVGMVRAFTYAGAQSVVASLWVANDQSTANIMVDFYRNLLKGMPKDQALQAARMHLFQEFPAQAHPYYWAGFRVYGAATPVW